MSFLHSNTMRLHPHTHTLFPPLKRINQLLLSTPITQWQKCSVKLYTLTNSTHPRGIIIPCAKMRLSEVNHKDQTVQLSFNNFQRELDDLFNEVKSMIKMGKENDAMDLLKANYESVKDRDKKGIEEAALLDVIALCYITLGDLTLVGPLLDELKEIIHDLSNEEPLMDSILIHMSSMYAKLEKYDTSVCLYERAIKIMETKYGNSTSLLATPLLGLAKAFNSIGKNTKAVETYERVIEILESVKGKESEELVLPLFALANLFIKEGKTEDAENLYTRVLNIYGKLYGEKDGRVGMAMCSLAHAKCAKGDLSEAIDLYKKALKIIEESNYMALDDNVMEKMRIDLAELLHIVGRGEEGRILLEKCLFISEKFKGKEDPSSVNHLINLATSCSRSKNYVEAERLLRICIEIMMKNVGPDDQSITFPMLHLSVTLYNLNRDEEAEELALEVVRIREKVFGKDSIPVGEALECLVSIQTRLEKDDDKLLIQLKRLLKIQEKAFGYDSEEVIETLKKIVFYMEKMGKKDELFPIRRRLVMLREKYIDMVKF